MKCEYILIRATSLYRVESRYKKAYLYEGVALKHARRIRDKEIADFKTNPCGGRPEEIRVVDKIEYRTLIDGKGSWKTGQNGKPIWIAFDTPACCDPTTETYMSM